MDLNRDRISSSLAWEDWFCFGKEKTRFGKESYKVCRFYKSFGELGTPESAKQIPNKFSIQFLGMYMCRRGEQL